MIKMRDQIDIVMVFEKVLVKVTLVVWLVKQYTLLVSNVVVFVKK